MSVTERKRVNGVEVTDEYIEYRLQSKDKLPGWRITEVLLYPNACRDQFIRLSDTSIAHAYDGSEVVLRVNSLGETNLIISLFSRLAGPNNARITCLVPVERMAMQIDITRLGSTETRSEHGNYWTEITLGCKISRVSYETLYAEESDNREIK